MTIEGENDGRGLFRPEELQTDAFDDFVEASDENFDWLLEPNPCILNESTKLRLTKRRPFKIKFTKLPNYMQDVATSVGVSLTSVYQKSERNRKTVGVLQQNIKAKLEISIYGADRKPYDYMELAVESGEIIYLYNVRGLRKISERSDENPIALFQVHDVSLRYGTVTIGPLALEQNE